jgi:TPR repeat protein
VKIRCALFVAIVLVACRRDETANAPVDVPALIAGCRDLADCERVCALGRASACVAVGHAFEYGRESIEADPARAYLLYEKACALDDPGGCWNTAVLLESGRGVAKDIARAKAFYEKVCRMGSKSACMKRSDL